MILSQTFQHARTKLMGHEASTSLILSLQYKITVPWPGVITP